MVWIKILIGVIIILIIELVVRKRQKAFKKKMENMKEDELVERIKKITNKKKNIALVLCGVVSGLVCIILGAIKHNPVIIIAGIGSILLAVLHLAWMSKEGIIKPPESKNKKEK